jgi:zinc transport system substrate-binding protein
VALKQKILSLDYGLRGVLVKHFLLFTGLVIWFARAMAFSQALAQDSLQITVTIAPQKYFVEKIGGNLVNVSAMVPPGVNVHNYEPKPQQMVSLSKSKVYFAIGDPIEGAWLQKIISANPNILLVHTEKGIGKIPMTTHHHEEVGEQGHGTLDSHIWLAPHLVMMQARNILDALCRVDSTHRAVYQANYKKFIMELVELDLEISNIFAGKGTRIQFMVFHPAWGYFAQAYGLEQVPIEVEGKEPKPADLQRLIEEAKKRGIKVIFVQPQLSAKSAKAIADAIGGQVMNADDLALDWANNLRQMAQNFKFALR